MVKLSIIVPIYNVEQYLRKCVDSLLNQDLDNYEIILVDDGGTDGCPAICDEYAERAKSEEVRGKSFAIRVVHRENGGLSAARNSGIEVAQGEYVMFADSDDYIEPNVLGALLKQVETEQLDVLRYDYQNVRIVKSEEVRGKSEYEVFQPYKNPHKVDKRKDVVDGVTYLNERMGYECYAWQFVIKRSLLVYGVQCKVYGELKSEEVRGKSDGCLFTEGIHFEDVEWLPRMMLKAKRVGSTETVVYNYFWREGSITLTQGNKVKIRKNLDDRMEIIAEYGELRKQHPSCTWLRNMQSSMVAGVLTTVAREFYEKRDVYIKRLREWNVFPIAIADHGRTHAHRARIINVWGANAFCMIMRFAGVRCKV